MNCRHYLMSVLICCAGMMISGCGDDESAYEEQGPKSECTKDDCDPMVCGSVCAKFEQSEDEDSDGDGIPNSEDNCMLIYNPGQEDEDNNRVGDACESEAVLPDTDGDTIPNVSDNCVSVQNPDQKDSDHDGIGDACAEDVKNPGGSRDKDGDTIPDADDNCPDAANPDQKDSDGDGTGDACQTENGKADKDGDTIPDELDNCPDVANPDQKDDNGNNIGNACEPEQPKDTDGDTIPDELDNCPDTPNPDQKDADHNDIGDACETPAEIDTDGDTIPDNKDNCPDKPNPDQADRDNNNIGDACDVVQDGSDKNPYLIIIGENGGVYKYAGDTSKSDSRLIDVYPGHPNTGESGPEIFYKMTVPKKMKVRLYLDAEPSGVDVDIHLLSGLKISNKTVPAELFIDRSDKAVTRTLDAGTYYVVIDTFVSSGIPKPGRYGLNVNASVVYDGTKDDPVLINGGKPISAHYVFTDQSTTAGAKSNVFDTYDTDTTDEKGPEVIYKFTTNERLKIAAVLRKPEPSGVDIDLQLLSSLAPKLIERSDNRIRADLEPGTYYLTADSYSGKAGQYILDVQFRPSIPKSEELFNPYILKAVDYLDKNWKLRGYGSSAYTHDLPYGSDTIKKGPKAPYTMCVAAVAETILVAMEIYAKETGDNTIWNHLPVSSWTTLNEKSIKGHLWVNPSYKAEGTGDAVTSFGIGMTTPFKELKPGSFINLNRSSGSGHAVVFLAFLDGNCQEYDTYNDSIVGFKYYSSQGQGASGGFDYRYARFEGMETNCSSKRDAAILPKGSFQHQQLYLNTGMMYLPKYWLKTSLASGVGGFSGPEISTWTFDEEKYNGITEED